MSKVSVIVPIYNCEKYLRECLDSILAQTLEDIEIILIDDGSIDSSPFIIDEYAQKDKRIIPIHKANGGYGQACNFGLDKAKGDYIAIVEPDDYIEPKMFEDLYNLAKINQADVVKSSFYDFYDTEKYKAHKKKNWADIYNIPSKSFTILDCPEFFYFHPSVWSCIYGREFINQNKIRFVEASGAGWTDNPFQVQTLCLAQKIVYTDNAYYHWRKTNFEESKDIKDLSIPYKRSFEIHEWLKSKEITNENILANLYKREFEYIRIIIEACSLKKIRLCAKEIENIVNLMDERIINSHLILQNKEKVYFELIKKNARSFVLSRMLVNWLNNKMEHFIMLYILLILKFFNKKIMFWGASIFIEQFFNYHKVNTSNLLGIIDKNSARWGEKIGDYEVFPPEKLEDLKPDYVLLTIKNKHSLIYKDVKVFLRDKFSNIKLLPDLWQMFLD